MAPPIFVPLLETSGIKIFRQLGAMLEPEREPEREPDGCEPDGCEPDVCEPDGCKPDVCEPDGCKPDVCEPEPDVCEPEPDVCEPEPLVRPTHYHVLSDNCGFIGAFYSADDVNTILSKYTLIPLLIQRFEVAPGPVATIWVVLYRDLDSVAFVSNSRAEAERIQGLYNRIGLAYIDSIDYWEHPANKISKAAADRLETLSEAHKMFAEPDALEQLQARADKDSEYLEQLLKMRENGPIAKMLRENETITIFDCVVPRGTEEYGVSSAEVSSAEVSSAEVSSAEEYGVSSAEVSSAEVSSAEVLITTTG